jgi:hypothetical protein
MKARIELGIVDPADLEAAAEEGEESEDGEAEAETAETEKAEAGLA